ncbi:MAG: TraR/DksA family transcriptional regulator [Polymorphobacter sp.]|uniref:TraR/DksA family transcriptional regulator n=1 Tax=Polymorphobacter sp. TaxID=1909290 RepID=UPI003A8720DB
MTTAETLKARLVELEAEIARLDGETTQQLSPKFADQANDLEELGTNEALEAHYKQEIEQITRALHRIEAGTYGTCENCGADINPQRLKAQPDATRCINCAA